MRAASPSSSAASSFILELAAAPRAVAGDGRVLALAPQDAAILAWVALEGPTPRARLAQLLWPEKDAESARNSLRQRLFQLRKSVGAELVTGSATLSLAEGVRHDLEDADTVLGQTAGEDLAAGEYAQWLEQQRVRRRDRWRRSLVELAELAEQAKDWDDALTHAKELLALEPLSEDAHRRVMRLHYLAADRAAALLAFDACERVLKDEVGVRPSAETLALLATVQAAQPPASGLRARIDAALLRPPRLIGREAEWTELERAVAAAQVVLLKGEAGLGKSRLVGDFVRRAPQASILVGARAGDARVPYAAVVRLLRALVERTGEPAPPLRRTLARLLPEFGDPGHASDDGARMHAALESFVAAARGVQLIAVDDLHDADAASAEALVFLAGAGLPIAWVFAARPVEPGPLDRLLHSGRARRIALAPLGAAQIAELVDSLGIPGWSGAGLAPRLAQRTGGNPLLLLETLKSMPPGEAATALPVARSVTQLVGQRIARLSSEAVRIARCAALAGQDFSVELATHLLGAGPLELADAWAELEAAHVLHDQAFAHDLIREAAEASVPAPLARELHRQIAEHLASRAAPRERIAAHWQASATPARAVPHLLQAGHHAVAMLRWDEAGDALVAAADLLERDGDGAAAFEAIDAMFRSVRSPSDALFERLLQRLLALAETPLQRGRAAERQAGKLAQRGELQASSAVAAAALEGFAHAQAPALAAMLTLHCASGTMQRGANDEAVRTMYRAVALAEASGDDDAQHRCVASLAVALNLAGRAAEAEPHFVRSLEIAKRRGDPIDIVDASLELTALRMSTGHLAQARTHHRFAEQLAAGQGLDADRLWPWMPLQRFRLDVDQARYADAVRGLDTAAAALAAHMPAWVIALRNAEASLWMRLGQWARARQASLAALTLGDGAFPLYAAQARLRAIELDLAEGRRDAALAAADAALVQWGTVSPRAALQLALARTRAAPPGEALDAAVRAGSQARSQGLLGLALDAEVLACEAALRGADAMAAQAHARAALAMFESVEPALLCRADVWLAAVRALDTSDRPLAERLLRQALHWLRETASEQVPDEFRAGFLERNEVNRELLALAARWSLRLAAR